VRLLICAGGTGGGVYPALTILQALKMRAEQQSAELTTLWVGGIGGMEADLVSRAGVSFRAIPAAGVHGVNLLTLPGNLWRLFRGYFTSREILRSFKPDVMLFTGGYVAVPMALASRGFFGRKIRSILYVPDIEPGLALQTLARFADRIVVTVKDSKRYFSRPERVTVAGYPVRDDLFQVEVNEAFRIFNLEPGLPVLLVLGGSTGARSVNYALIKTLPELLQFAQIIHITGQRDWKEIEAAAKSLDLAGVGHHYHPYPYLHDEIGAALCAADLVISRSGASTLGEYPALGLPAILVPYPYAWRYQQVNAEFLANHGAAVILPDASLDHEMVYVIKDLLKNPAKLRQMRSAMQKLARPEAAAQIAELIEGLVTHDGSER
jgi:UDP-N-acetylglucosamine--N-acetylmuramyl-(pentapeptide) pyrophosphoryl-undecaprenol N-acetylglucosamine transferase